MQNLIQKDIITKVSENFQTNPMPSDFDERLGPRNDPRTEAKVIEMVGDMIENNLEIFDAGFVDKQLMMPEVENQQRY